MKEIVKNKELFIILFFGLIVRIISANLYSDIILRNEWNMILHNFEISGVFGLNVVVNDFLALPKLAEVGDTVLPTAITPPLYLYLIYVIKLIFNDPTNIAKTVILIQIFLSLISILIFYKIIEFFSNKTILKIILTSAFSFFPMNVYAASQISSITLQIFLILNFLYFLFKFNEKKKNQSLIYFSFSYDIPLSMQIFKFVPKFLILKIFL